MSSGDPPATSWRKAERSFPAPRPAAASSGSCCAAAQLRHPDPPGTFSSCRELRESRRESGRAREPPTSLPHSLGRGKRRSASPKPSITPIGPTQRTRSPSHARAGTGRTPQQSACGGKGAPPPPSPPELQAAEKLLLPPPASSRSPPPFPLRLTDEPRALPQLAFPFGPRREGEEGSTGNCGAAVRPGWGVGWGSQSSGKSRIGAWGGGGWNVGASCRDSLP